MIEATPSRTAHSVAVARAAHQILDRPLVLHDPLALPILGLTTADESTISSSPFHQQRWGRLLRAKLAVRSRFAEEHLARAVAGGAAQYVVLGAGLDTFAYRNPFQSALKVFEVDFPATQAWKRERLELASIAVPASMVFVGVDFERQTAFEGLKAAGFDATVPTVFSWLGVTMYLTAETVFSVLGAIARLPRGSGVVLDYNIDPALLSPGQRRAVEAVSSHAASVGEPWTLAFDPAALTERLGTLGFSEVEDLDGAQINARYFANRDDELRVGHSGRLLYAAV